MKEKKILMSLKHEADGSYYDNKKRKNMKPTASLDKLSCLWE